MIYKAVLKCGKVQSDLASRNTAHKLLTKHDSCLSDIGDPTDSSLAVVDRDREEEASRPRRRAQTEGSKSMMALKKRKRKKFKVTASSLFAIVIYGEFLKELSAISLEHSVAIPQFIHDHSTHIHIQ